VSKGPADVFNKLRHDWVSVPTSIRDSFLSQQEDLIRLEARLHDDPHLARYDLEIYPEVVSLLGANPAAASTTDERAQLHFCNMQLDLMENIFLAIELEKSYAYALNRGWMNLFRRWAMTETFQKLWPGLRGGYSRQFTDFVEEHLLPCKPIKIVDLRKTPAPEIPEEVLARLAGEYLRDQLSMTIAPSLANVLRDSAQLKSCVGAWFAVPNSGETITEVWGAAVVVKELGEYDYQLFLWVRGAHRNLGIGGELLDQVESMKGKIVVDLGDEKLGDPSYGPRKAAWLRLYGQRGFTRVAEKEAPEKQEATKKSRRLLLWRKI
jgi:GNAT superfamily N-acetyltransferase